MHPHQPLPSSRDAAAREKTAKILHARALALASEPKTGPPAIGGRQVLEFALGDERYAVPTAQVLAVRFLGDFSPVPCTPAMVVGVVNHRGRLFSVIDLGIFFGWPAKKPGSLDKVILVHEPEMETGIRVDAVAGMGTLFPADIHPAPATLAAAGGNCLQGVTGDGLIVLDLRKVLLDKRIRVQEDVE